MEVILHFLEMVIQHSHLGYLHGIEFPSLDVVTWITIGLFDLGGSWYCVSLAFTSVFARLFVLLRLRQGLGTLLISLGLGLRIFLSDLVSRLVM